MPFPSPCLQSCRSYYPQPAETAWVWANPGSLATTTGITVVFSSCGYLDVSVPHVRLSFDIVLKGLGCPIRTSADHFASADPRGFSQLGTSFLASESLGIPRAPLFTYSFNHIIRCSRSKYSVTVSTQYVNELASASHRGPEPRKRIT